MRLTSTVFEPVTDFIHGVAVVDPYRWLEDRALPQTEAWIHEQQKRCEDYFAHCPGLEAIKSRVREYLDVEVVDQPARVGSRYFYRRRNRGQEQGCIYLRDISTEEERLLVNPSEQGPFTSVGIHRIAPDGSLLAYELKRGGGDRKSIHILDVETCRTLPDQLEVGYGRGFTFTSNNEGFYYCHETQIGTGDHTIRLHRFHHPEADKVVFRAPRTRESRLVMIADSQHLGAVLLHQEASELVADFSIAPRSEHLAWTRLFHDKKLPCNPILCHGRIFVLTETDNDKYTVIELTLEGQELRTIVPEQGASIRQLVVAQGRIYVSYLEQTTPRIRVLSSNGDDLGFVDTPSGGSVQLLMNYSETESDCLYTYESFDKDLSILEYIAKTGSSRLWHQRPSATIRRDFNVRNVTFRSKDDTSVPLTLVSFDVAKQNRPRPVIMTTYGGFGVSLTPQFSVLVAMMMEHGAVFALPHVRGGGEYGKPWHDSGRARNRQNSADDFIAAAEWLCERHVTTPKQIAAFGGSNSGLLVGAALTQRPELFGAVLCIAPLLDMVRYESFDQAVKWRREYGTINDPEDFRALHAFSPYHRVGDDIDYPSALFVTGDKDDRCNPAHARKMAARLQDRNAQKAPVIVDHSEQRGHSPVLPLSVRVDALARRVAFLCNELRIIPTKEGLHEALHP